MALAELDCSPLQDGFAGELVVPGDPSYDEARTIFNAMIDRRPAVIAQCQTARDVANAIRFGRERGLEIAVRGGGHGVAGKALTDDGIVIDLRRMSTVTVDADARTATVAGGATMSHLDRATEPYGLVTTGGRVSTTGVGGLTLGGGNGWLDRKFGLACDNLLSVELVTADGSVVHASEEEHPELFWALHGGGGNFGVATSFTFRLYPLPQVTAALLLWPAEAGPDLVRVYRDFMESAPDEVCGALVYVTGPPEEFVPQHLVGEWRPPADHRQVDPEPCRPAAPLVRVDRELIETTAGGYRLAVDPEAVDAVAFERLATDGRRRLAAGERRGRGRPPPRPGAVAGPGVRGPHRSRGSPSGRAHA